MLFMLLWSLAYSYQSISCWFKTKNRLCVFNALNLVKHKLNPHPDCIVLSSLFHNGPLDFFPACDKRGGGPSLLSILELKLP